MGQPRTAIIGGGIGGLTAAIALARRGCGVTVYEQALAFGEVGAGLQLGPNAMRVLAALGVADAVRAAGRQPEAVVLRDGLSGAGLTRFPLGPALEARLGHPFVNIHRADLVAVLAQAAVDAGVAMELTARAYQVDPGTGAVTFADSRVVSADLVVAADGMKSPIRQAVFAPRAPRFNGFVAWRALIAKPAGWPSEVRVWLAPGAHIVTYPLREDLLNIVAVERQGAAVEETWGLGGDPNQMRARFARFCPDVAALLGEVSTVLKWGLYTHPVPARWTSGAVALLGDAAHPTLPYLAQGAGLAIEDAGVLALEVARATSVADALAAYQAARVPRARKVVRAAHKNGRLYHAGGLARGVRNAGFGVLNRVAPGHVERRFDWLYGADVLAR